MTSSAVDVRYEPAGAGSYLTRSGAGESGRAAR